MRGPLGLGRGLRLTLIYSFHDLIYIGDVFPSLITVIIVISIKRLHQSVVDMDE